MPRRKKPIGKDLARARERFERWRSRRQGRSPVPSELWSLAVSLAHKHGVSRVAKVLGLQYPGLKQRVSEATSSEKDSGPRFIELPFVQGPRSSGAAGEWSLELEHPVRGKLTVRSAESIDLVALMRAFVEEAS